MSDTRRQRKRKRVSAMDVLHYAHDKLLRSAKHWTQQAAARNACHFSVEAENRDAISWCLGGALSRAAYDLTGASQHRVCESAAWKIQRVTGVNLVIFNDRPGRTFREVRAVLRQAIKRDLKNSE